MKKQNQRWIVNRLIVAWIVSLSLAPAAHAGVPFNNRQGAGGAAFKPLAYQAGQNKNEKSTTTTGLGDGVVLSVQYAF